MFFDIYKTTSSSPQQYWWVAKRRNGETLCHSEMLSSKQACKNAIRTVQDDAAYAGVYDETGETVGDTSARRISV